MANSLEHLAEFERILEDYHIASDNPLLHSTDLVLMIGASGSGRDTTISKLVQTSHYYHVVSNTTREPRINNGVLEQDGVEYWFRSEAEMLDDLQQKRMLEAEIIHNQHVSGISLAELERAAAQHKTAITNVDLNIGNITKAKPDAIPIMMLPPSFEEGFRRLKGRGDLEPEEIHRRMTTAVKIYQAGLEWGIFFFVVNDTLGHAVQQVEAAVRRETRLVEQEAGKILVETLLKATNNWLEHNGAKPNQTPN